MDRSLSVALLMITPLLWGASPGDGNDGRAAAAAKAAVRPVPPVMRRLESADSGVLRLPVPKQTVPAPAPAPVETAAPAPAPEKDPHPTVKPAIKAKPKPDLPEEFLLDSGIFCQKKIGRWTLAEAKTLLGEPVRDRASVDEATAASGRIYAFRDPTARNREIELDFGGKTGRLRTVYVYPWRMSWSDCTRRWGVNASVLQANKGRTFYSYLDRRLDVLVEPDGRVISVGLY